MRSFTRPRLYAFLLTAVLAVPSAEAQFRKFPTTVPKRLGGNLGGGNFGTPSAFNGGYTGNSGFSGNFGNPGFNVGNFGNFGNFGVFTLPEIPPGTPARDLIPSPLFGSARPWWGHDLRRVPEVGLTAPLHASDEGVKDVLRLLGAALHLDQQQREGFLDALAEHRPDLAGLPFLKGDACRTPRDEMNHFQRMRDLVRDTAMAVTTRPPDLVGPLPKDASHQMGDPQRFWKRLPLMVRDWNLGPVLGPLPEKARVSALTQMCGPETAALQSGLVDMLKELPGIESTQALARLVLFGPDDKVRSRALEALRGRSEDAYTGILVEGLRYPWPAVADRAATGIASLERTDLVSTLNDALDQPDPRQPRSFYYFGKEVQVVRELVRVNHHRNCLLCHAPIAPTATAEPGKDFFAGIPLPDRSLGSLAVYYGGGGPQVAFNFTYLRQDFSLMQKVEERGAWSELQRFDFFVRMRVVTPREAEHYAEVARRDGEGEANPYRRAVVRALGRLTRPDAAAGD